MKKVSKLPILSVLLLIALLAVSIFGLSKINYAKAESHYDYYYGFEVTKYDLTYDISNNCNISVSEDIEIYYYGHRSTGFKRDIPVNGGVQVRNVNVTQLVNGTETYVWYDVLTEDNDFLTIDIGDYDVNKYNTKETYRITYNYLITNSVVNGSLLPLNVIGHGWDCTISNASVKIIVPDGYIGAKCYVGASGTSIPNGDFNDSGRSDDGRVIITAFFNLEVGEGVTFDLSFENGSIKNYTDLTPYIFSIVAAVILAIVILLKLFVFNKNYITPVVNFEAPNKMDPLLMGKLIDNKVNNEDVTSLIYYWAGKGYIKINLDNQSDPLLIRINQNLPEPCPSYERLMYNSLFASGDMVKISQLKNKFYKTVEQVTATVNKQTKNLYDKKSLITTAVFTVIAGLLLGLAPMLLAMTRISLAYITLSPFIVLIPIIVLTAFALSLKYNSLKISKGKFIGLSIGIALIAAIVGAFYIYLVPSSIIGIGPKTVLYILCCLVSFGSVTLISRTKEYSEKLNDIIGFKQFILLAEKDRLEMMLEQDPQFYYHILPYAQVLGVTDKWEEKFKGLTVQPPQWLTGNVVTTYVEFRIINSMIMGSMRHISSGMVSRPASAGRNGGGGRGFGGGFSGGGFGGGGGRGR